MLGIPKFPSHFKLKLERVPVEILRSEIVTARAFITHPSGKEEDLHNCLVFITKGYSREHDSSILSLEIVVKNLSRRVKEFNVLLGIGELKVAWNSRTLSNRPRFGRHKYSYLTDYSRLKNLMDKRDNNPLQL